MSAPSNPIAAAFAATPWWMLAIRSFDAIEVHPCCVVSFADGKEIVETCDPEAAVLILAEVSKAVRGDPPNNGVCGNSIRDRTIAAGF